MKNIKNKNKKKRNQGNGINIPNRSYIGKENFKLTFIDPVKYVTLRYVEQFTQSLSTLTGGQQTMNLNSLFDPNRTGTGHQPYGFDQLAALYNRYRVYKTSWRITYGAQGNTVNLVVIPVNGLLASTISDVTTFQLAGEMPRAVIKTQGGVGAPTTVFNGGIRLETLTSKPTEYEVDDRFEALVSSSPSEVLTLAIGAYNPQTSTAAVTFTVELWFECDFHDIISQSGS